MCPLTVCSYVSLCVLISALIIYIYIERERERCIYTYVYIYVHKSYMYPDIPRVSSDGMPVWVPTHEPRTPATLVVQKTRAPHPLHSVTAASFPLCRQCRIGVRTCVYVCLCVSMCVYVKGVGVFCHLTCLARQPSALLLCCQCCVGVGLLCHVNRSVLPSFFHMPLLLLFCRECCMSVCVW